MDAASQPRHPFHLLQVVAWDPSEEATDDNHNNLQLL